MGTLYIVATPIGNLEDFSFRALRILKECRLIAAEDTRHTRKLLNRYEISTRMISYHEHNKVTRLADVLEALEQGDVALVSDAGTPGINDPGYELIRACIEAKVPVSPVPGASAPIAALVISGLPTDRFTYAGYLPRKTAERRAFLQNLARHEETLIFLETPHRLAAAMEDLVDVLGNRQACLASELTKMFESVLRATLAELRELIRAETPRGEFTLVVAGAQKTVERWSEGELEAYLARHTGGNQPKRQLAEEIAKMSGWGKNEIYRRLVRGEA